MVLNSPSLWSSASARPGPPSSRPAWPLEIQPGATGVANRTPDPTSQISSESQSRSLNETHLRSSGHKLVFLVSFKPRI